MADDNSNNLNEQYIDALSDTSSSMEQLIMGVVALGSRSKDLSAIVEQTGMTMEETINLVSRITKQMGYAARMTEEQKALVRGNVAGRSGFDFLGQMTNQQQKALQNGLQGLMQSALSELDTKDAKSSMTKFNTELSGLMTDLSNSIKANKAMIKARVKKPSSPLDSISGSGSAVYKTFAADMAATKLASKDAKNAIKAVYTQLPASRLYYSASTGNTHHQPNSDVFTHSMDAIQAVKEVTQGKNLDQFRKFMVSSGIGGMEKANTETMIKTYMESQGLSTKGLDLASILKSKLLQDTLAGSLLVHDLGKSSGSSITEGDTFRKDHADLLPQVTKDVVFESEEQEKLVAGWERIASTHHADKLSDTVMANASPVEQVAAVLTRIGDGISAMNNNPKGPNGKPEPIQEGYTQRQIPSRNTIADDPKYRALRESSFAEEDKNGFIFRKLADLVSGNMDRAASAKDTLEGMGLSNMVKMAMNSSEDAAKVINYAAGAEGKSVIGTQEIGQAIKNLIGDHDRDITDDGKQVTAAEIGKALQVTEPILSVAKTLMPGLFKGIEDTFKTVGAGDKEVNTSALKRSKGDQTRGAIKGSAVASQPDLELANKTAFLAESVESNAPKIGSSEDEMIKNLEDFSTGMLQNAENTKKLAKPVTDATSKIQEAGEKVNDTTRYHHTTGIQSADTGYDAIDALRQKLALQIQNQVLSDKDIGLRPQEVSTGDALQKAIGNYVKGGASRYLTEEDLATLAKAQKDTMAANKTYLENTSGKPQAEVMKILAEIDKAQQQVYESIAKEAVMASRAKKTDVETSYLSNTMDSRVAEASAKATKEEEAAKQEIVNTNTQLATQEDKINQTKAQTVELMSKLTSEQQAQIKSVTQQALKGQNLDLKTFGKDDDTLSKLDEYNKKADAVTRAQKALVKTQQASATNSAKSAGAVQAAGTDEKALAAAKATATYQEQADAKAVAASRTKLNSAEKELNLAKQKLTIESETAATQAKASTAQSQANVQEQKALQAKIQTAIQQATQEDQIEQAKLKTLQMQQDLKAKILSNSSRQLSLNQAQLTNMNQQVAAAKQLVSQGALLTGYQAIRARTSNGQAKYNPSGMPINFGAIGPGINGRQLAYSAKNFTWGAMGGLVGIGSSVQLLRQAVSNMKDYETATVNLKRVWQDVPNNQFLVALSDLNDMALKYGQTIQNVASIQEAWAKVGVETANDLNTLSQTAILALNTSDMTDADSVVAYLNSARVQMKLTAKDTDDLLDSWNKLADVTTADTSDFAEAYQKSAGYAKQLGLSTRELDAIIATLIENTGRSGQEVGTALRQTFSNVYSPLNIKKLQGLGIDVFGDGKFDEANGVYKSFDELLGQMAEKYKQLKSASGGALSKDMQTLLGVLGNSRQRNYAVALLEGYDKSGLGANKIAGNYMQTSEDSAGYSQKKFEMTTTTLAYKATQLEAAFTKAAKAFGDTGVLDVTKDLLGFLTKILDGFSDLDPATRNWVTSLGLASMAVAGLGKLNNQVFGQSFSKSIAEAILNTKHLTDAFNKAKEQVTDNAVGLNKKDYKSTFTKDSIDVGLGTGAVSRDGLIKSLEENKKLKAEILKIMGGDQAKADKAFSDALDTVRIALGDEAAQARVNAEVQKAADEAMNSASESAKKAAEGATILSDAESKENKTSQKNTATNLKQGVAQKVVAESSDEAAAKVTGAKIVDVLEGDASADAAVKNQVQAAAERELAAAATQAALKTAALQIATGLLITGVIALTTTLFMNKDASKERTEAMVVQVTKEGEEIRSLEELKSKYEDLQASMTSATATEKEKAAASEQLKEVSSQICDLAPGLAGYYDQEYGLLLRNNQELADYIAYKKQLASQHTDYVVATSDAGMAKQQKVIDKNKAILDTANKLALAGQRVNDEFTQNKNGSYTENATGKKFNSTVDLLNYIGIDPAEGTTHREEGTFYRNISKGVGYALIQESIKVMDDNPDIEKNLNEAYDTYNEMGSNKLSAAIAQKLQNDKGNKIKITLTVQPEIDKIETDTSLLDSQTSDSETAADSVDKVQEALTNIFSQKDNSTKYKAGLSTLQSNGYADVPIIIDGKSTTLNSMSPSDIKSHSTQITKAIQDAVNANIDSEESTLTGSIQTIQRDIKDLETKKETLQKTIDDRKAQQDAILKKYGTVDNMKDKDNEAYVTYEALGSEINRAETDKQKATTALANAADKLSSANDALAKLPDKAEFELPDYTQLAQDFEEKLSKAKNEADKRTILKSVSQYFGDIKLTVDGVTQTLDETDPNVALQHLDQVILGMNAKAVANYNETYGAVAEYNNSKTNFEKAVMGISKDSGANGEQVIKDIAQIFGKGEVEKIDTMLDSLNTTGGLGIKDQSIQNWVSQYADGAAEANSFANQAAQSLNTLSKAYKSGGFDALDASVQNSYDNLVNLFGNVKVMGKNLGDFSSQEIAANADAVTTAIDGAIDAKNKAAEAAIDAQLKVVDEAGKKLQEVIDSASKTFDIISKVLGSALTGKLESPTMSYLNGMKSTMDNWSTYLNQVKSTIESSKSSVASRRSILSGGGGGGGGNKWAALDKQMKAIEKRIKSVTTALDILQTVWAKDQTNQRYVTQAYADQNKLIATYTQAIKDVTKLREKTRGDEDKYDELTANINEYTKAIIQAYQEQSELMKSMYEGDVTDYANSLSYANSKLEAYIGTLRPYEKYMKSFTAEQEYWAQNMDSISAQTGAYNSELDQLRKELAQVKSAAASSSNAFKKMYAQGSIDYLTKSIADVQNKLTSLAASANEVRTRMVGVFENILTTEYNDRLDQELKTIKDIRKEEQKRHEDKVKELQDLLTKLDEENEADQDKRDLEDIEANLEIARIKVRRLSADTSQYGQKLLKDAYKEMGDLERQYTDKQREIADKAYKKKIQDQIDAENDSYDKQTKAMDDEEQAYQDHYQALIDNANSFAQGLFDRYMKSQTDVINYLKSQGLLDQYTKAGKLANAAYYSGLNLSAKDQLTKNGDDYSNEPTDLYGNAGDTSPSTTTFDPTYDYTKAINDVVAKMKKTRDLATYQSMYEDLQTLEQERNEKLKDPRFSHWGSLTYLYQEPFETWLQRNPLPKAHTGGVIGQIPDVFKSMFGLKPKETLVKALEGEYLIPGEYMKNVLPNIQSSMIELLKSKDLQLPDSSFLNLSNLGLDNTPKTGDVNTDNSTTIDKVLNIEHATFENDLDVSDLERVGGRYLKDILVRKGVTQK